MARLTWPPDGYHRLTEDAPKVVIGRGGTVDLRLRDPTVSQPHLWLVQAAESWIVEDLGSLNGSHLVRQGVRTRLVGPTRLRDQDLLEVGRTLLKFHADIVPLTAVTMGDAADWPELTQREFEVLECLSQRELTGIGGYPTDQEIAAQLSIAVTTVRTHLSHLFRKFDLKPDGIGDKQQRGRLVRGGIALGMIRSRS
jgi:pSer/pThr/pTyr-binding forkhead associated (FHA) protein